ncbi:rod shape-determining protein MreD [Riemerella anatipestifer]|uniref:rod shape-determining protein MreD n=1 Tax=Riemerella anatipestifer TaxID=34085 RepID=UPI00129DDFAD|nr:rod shape-determining protein MreD [Riemerella anatipestifer]MRM97198.1 rod shape-determining protein MreD [Riemerella anatipestifer]MRN01007.1 rod shape-determining protein MreD [Riemerella anatipestifer]MRN03174.1 rod shape-determining protein MreD [Riemerella anatipestifer]
MISRNIFTDILFSVILVTAQIFLFNKISIAGAYTPVVYPVLIMFYPFYRNLYVFLVVGFLLGLGIDAFLGTWGINALAMTIIAYFRTLIFKTSIDNEATDSFSFQNIRWTQFLMYIFFSILIHQLLVQFIEFFKLNRILEISLNVLITSVISFVFILLYVLIFKIKQKV